MKNIDYMTIMMGTYYIVALREWPSKQSLVLHGMATGMREVLEHVYSDEEVADAAIEHQDFVAFCSEELKDATVKRAEDVMHALVRTVSTTPEEREAQLKREIEKNPNDPVLKKLKDALSKVT